MKNAEIVNLFRERFSAPPECVARAPGRVNLLGEHVDYNDGPVLPAAIDRAVYLAVAPSGDERVSLYAADLDQACVFDLNILADKVDAEGQPLPPWALYPAGVAWALQEAGLDIGGVQVAYTSDVPIGAGLSSSAAVVVRPNWVEASCREIIPVEESQPAESYWISKSRVSVNALVPE